MLQCKGEKLHSCSACRVFLQTGAGIAVMLLADGAAEATSTSGTLSIDFVCAIHNLAVRYYSSEAWRLTEGLVDRYPHA